MFERRQASVSAAAPARGGSETPHFQLTLDGDHAGTVIALLYGADCLIQGLLGDLLVLLGNRIDPDRQEIQQLRGQADKRQVQGARIALQHNLGLGGACVVTMYEKVSA